MLILDIVFYTPVLKFESFVTRSDLLVSGTLVQVLWATFLRRRGPCLAVFTEIDMSLPMILGILALCGAVAGESDFKP
ncbi:hypothetical protein [Adhaeretor mobilis]|uniref:hypothetical protein n=1 Tax=Adhaeretor mobilis TaxID=1930276 RepID=UPI0011A57DA1|nr:hypothetical protein [Adhaeretor mobilis]